MKWLIPTGMLFVLDICLFGNSTAQVTLSISDHSANHGTVITIPVNVSQIDAEMGILSYQFDISFDPKVLKVLGATKEETITPSSWSFLVNPDYDVGVMRIGAYDPAYYLAGTGVLANLQFEVIGWPVDISPLNLSNVFFNDGSLATILHNGSFTVNLVLFPVELISFTVDNPNNDIVELKWSTASERNNYGFQIERKFQDGQFEPVGFVPGHMTSSDIQFYNFQEKIMQAGIYHYRLKQLDLNGEFKYFPEASIEIKPTVDFVLQQNYPNPFSSSSTITFMVPTILSGNNANLVIFDSNGKEVQQFNFAPLEAGVVQVIWDGMDNTGRNLAAGVYFYRLKIGREQRLMKLLYVK